jgi:2-polyprenyl-3-methyl-5-hydroxy-6-metoxy-1,4-benzoquinol methylase
VSRISLKPKTPKEAHRAYTLNNSETVASYNICARTYAGATAPSANHRRSSQGLSQLLDNSIPNGLILEVGSGPGWDADYLESKGLRVRRTDISEEFIQLQAERGKTAELLDITSDGLKGPYDAVMALYVLQHIDRDVVGIFLNKVFASLKPAGSLLTSIRIGYGTLKEIGSSGESYHIALWPRSAFERQLGLAGFSVKWSARTTDEDGTWLSVLASKAEERV